jgi:membrane fusion protein, multidrug efflux system
MTENNLPNKKRRNEVIFGLLIIFFLCASTGLGYWYYFSLHYETTNDAYVEGNLTRLSSQIPSFVKTFYCQEGDFVVKGQLLAQLDTQIAVAKLNQAEAYLALTVRQTEGLFQKAEQAKLGLIISEIQKNEARLIAENRSQIADSGAIPIEEIERTKANYNAAVRQFQIAQSQNLEVAYMTFNTEINSHPSVKQAINQYIEAFINLRQASIYAPFDGYILQQLSHVGENVGPGSPILSLIPKDQMWVTANFQETQLSRIQPGQKVLMCMDVYGCRQEFEGVVRGVVPSTGAYLSLLPPQNATGNWVKVVQRVPVIVDIVNPNEERNHLKPLLVGLSSYVKVILEDTGKPLLPLSSDKQFVSETNIESNYFQEAQNRAHEIIAENKKV